MPDDTPMQHPVEVRLTPELLDSTFWELIDTHKTDYVQIPYGAYHPNARDFPAHRLINEEVVSHNVTRRWWTTDFSNQDVYNYSIKYGLEDVSSPMFIRRYIVRRDLYAPLEILGEFMGVWQVIVTNGGSGYSPQTTVTIAGAGSGATAEAVIADGVIVWIRVTSEGDSYTGAITVTIADAGGGAGAAATAVTHPEGCKLVKQELEELPDGDNRKSLFVLVVRAYKILPGHEIYERGYDTDTGGRMLTIRREVENGTPAATLGSTFLTFTVVDSTAKDQDVATCILTTIGLVLPSPELSRPGFDDETGATTRVYRQKVAVGTTVPTPGSIKDGRIVMADGTRYVPINSVYGWLEISTMSEPPSRIEYHPRGYQFPAVFAYLAGWPIPAPSPFRLTGPFQGVHYSLTTHRTATKAATVTITYTNGPTGSVPEIFTVTTPGAGSRFYPVGENTIHNSWTLYEVDPPSGLTQTIEVVDQSDPNNYIPGETLVIAAEERQWKGPIWKQVTITVSE